MPVRILRATSLAALLLPVPAAAQTTAAADGEVSRCIVAMIKVGDSVSGAEKASVNGVMLYFLGKLSVRHSPAEITALIERAAADGKLDVASTDRDCAKEVEVLGTAMQRH